MAHDGRRTSLTVLSSDIADTDGLGQLVDCFHDSCGNRPIVNTEIGPS